MLLAILRPLTLNGVPVTVLFHFQGDTIKTKAYNGLGYIEMKRKTQWKADTKLVETGITKSFFNLFTIAFQLQKEDEHYLKYCGIGPRSLKIWTTYHQTKSSYRTNLRDATVITA